MTNSKMGAFWSDLRVERNVKLETIAKDTGLQLGALQTYFSGEHIPREYASRVICNYFDIPYEQGRVEFIKAHVKFNRRHDPEWFVHDKLRESVYHYEYNRTKAIPYCIHFDRIKDADLINKLSTIESGKRSAYIRNVLRRHLGNDTFSTERLTPEVQELLKIIYSEVPFEIFMQMLSSLLDTKTIDDKLLYGYVSYDTYLKIYRLQDNI